MCVAATAAPAQRCPDGGWATNRGDPGKDYSNKVGALPPLPPPPPQPDAADVDVSQPILAQVRRSRIGHPAVHRGTADSFEEQPSSTSRSCTHTHHRRRQCLASGAHHQTSPVTHAFVGNLPAGLRAVPAQSPLNVETCRSLGNKWGAWGRAARRGSTRRGPTSGSICAIILTFLTLSFAGGAPRAALRGVGAFSRDRRPAFLCLACRRGADAHRLVSDTFRVVALRASRCRARATKLSLAGMSLE